MNATLGLVWKEVVQLGNMSGINSCARGQSTAQPTVFKPLHLEIKCAGLTTRVHLSPFLPCKAYPEPRWLSWSQSSSPILSVSHNYPPALGVIGLRPGPSYEYERLYPTRNLHLSEDQDPEGIPMRNVSSKNQEPKAHNHDPEKPERRSERRGRQSFTLTASSNKLRERQVSSWLVHS